MKRIAIFCDGTWNRLSSEFATNVQFAAQAVRPSDDTGVQQLTFYDEGVGSSYVVSEFFETLLAGAFGWGLLGKIEAAYRFLAFNYEPGDEIYIFGFSRGAYTARSLTGLIRKCGIMPRTAVKTIKGIFDFYKRADVHPDSDEAMGFRMLYSSAILMKESEREWRRAQGAPPEQTDGARLIDLKYVGVWDTVGALGVPRHLPFIDLFGTQRKYQFHDTNLSSVVQAARHAVAVDEDRRSFEPALWDNLDELNKGGGSSYQQLWFPGDHGSVGGGGDIVGLSSAALLWVLEGAQAQGLSFNQTLLDGHVEKCDCLVPLNNTTKRGFLNGIFVRGPRTGPAQRELLAKPTIERLCHEAAGDGWRLYRPKTLEAIHRNAPHFS